MVPYQCITNTSERYVAAQTAARQIIRVHAATARVLLVKVLLSGVWSVTNATVAGHGYHYALSEVLLVSSDVKHEQNYSQ